jgi:RNA methyltransferase, TrmH family
VSAEIRQITSLTNPEIKKIRSLAQRKYREEEKLFITEGLRHALEAAEAGWAFRTLVIEENVKDKDLVRRLLDACAKQNPLILEVPAHIMESISKRDNAQNVITVLEQKWMALEDAQNHEGLWVALEEIRDPGNLGTIMRTADATGAKGIILIENTCDPYSLEAIRASMGSFPHVRLVRCSRQDFMTWAEKIKWPVIGTHLKTTHDYRAVSYKFPAVLLMGNEQAGLTDELAQACTALVKIPMRGKADSLNVSVATAVMLFEMNKAELKI